MQQQSAGQGFRILYVYYIYFVTVVVNAVHEFAVLKTQPH